MKFKIILEIKVNWIIHQQWKILKYKIKIKNRKKLKILMEAKYQQAR